MRNRFAPLVRLFSIVFCCSVIYGCGSEDPYVDNSLGTLVVYLHQEGNDEKVDFSEYAIALTPEYGHGFGTSAQVKDIKWPVELPIGTYSVAAASPLVAETDSTETWYYGEVKDVKIHNDITTEVTVSLKLTVYPKPEQSMATFADERE